MINLPLVDIQLIVAGSLDGRVSQIGLEAEYCPWDILHAHLYHFLEFLVHYYLHC
jgi:hypothetical protein